MREIRQHGSEGGGPELNRASLPLSVSRAGQAGRLSHGKQDRRDACPKARGTLAPREGKNRAEQDCHCG